MLPYAYQKLINCFEYCYVILLCDTVHLLTLYSNLVHYYLVHYCCDGSHTYGDLGYLVQGIEL